jgi:hypothetical protein
MRCAMKLGSTVAASLFSAIFLASAQSPPPVTVSVQQGVSGPTSGLATLSISNTSQKTITAIAFVGDPVDVPASKAGVRITVSPLKIYDAATEPRAARPIAPGQLVAIAVPFPSRDASVPPTVRAVLFVDGTSWGDLAWANRLANRRALMEKALTDAISDLRGRAGCRSDPGSAY